MSANPISGLNPINQPEHPISSFSETVLLNKHFLNLICPSHCENSKIAQVGESIFDNLDNSETDIFANKWKGKFHYTALRALFQTAAIGLVNLTVSPLGSLYFGCISLKYYIDYKNETNTLEKNAKWKKTEHYANAFFTDFRCLFRGAFFVGGTIITARSSVKIYRTLNSNLSCQWGLLTLKTNSQKIIGLVMSILGMGICALMSPILNPSNYLSHLLRKEKLKAPLFLALELRRKLGWVDEKGDVLKFSKADIAELKITSQQNAPARYEYNPAFESATQLVAYAELALLDKVIEADEWLYEHQLSPLPFSHPFNGNVVADILRKALEEPRAVVTSNDQRMVIYEGPGIDVKQVINDLRGLQFKVEALKTIYRFYLFFSTRTLPKLDSFIERDLYENIFLDGFGEEEIEDYHTYFKNIPLTSLDPATQALSGNETYYERFLYHVRINKWKVENGQDLTPFTEWVPGKNDPLYKKYQLALHPDKHGNTQESEELFKIFVTISASLHAN